MRTVFIVIFSLVCFKVFSQSEISFEKNKSFKVLKARAKKENKLIFIDTYTTWCSPCKWMDKNIFTNSEVADYYNNNFINVKFDAEDQGEGTKIKKLYNIESYPTLLFIDGDGNLIHQILEISKNPQDYIKFAEKAQGNFKNSLSVKKTIEVPSGSIFTPILVNIEKTDSNGYLLKTNSFPEGSFIFICPLTDFSEKVYMDKIIILQNELISSGLTTKDKIYFILSSCKNVDFNDCVLNELDINKESKKSNYIIYFTAYYFSKEGSLLSRYPYKEEYKINKSPFSDSVYKIEIVKCPDDTPSQIPLFKNIIMETLQPNYSDAEKIFQLEKQIKEMKSELIYINLLLEIADTTIKSQSYRINRLEVLIDRLNQTKIKSLEQENYKEVTQGEYVLPEKKKSESPIRKIKFGKKEKNDSEN
jgi:thiol-disulfide isomerase/thioredoxin